MSRKVEVTSYGLKLPSLSDNFAISMYMESFLSLVLGLIILFHPSLVNARENSVIQMVIPAICITIAFTIQIFNTWRNTVVKTRIAALNHDRNIQVLTTNEYKFYYGAPSVRQSAKAAVRKDDLKHGVTAYR